MCCEVPESLSDFVGPNVRHFRELRGWRRPELVKRLEMLGTSRTGRSWDQVKVLRIESGQRQKIYLEDLAELALALDVSPLQLIVPHGDDAAQVHVTVGGAVDRRASDVKQWFRGVKPLLGRNDHRTNEEAVDGHRFYWAGATTIGELTRLEDAVKQARRARASLSFFEPGDEGEAGAE
jgi:transcriptional regulator with XRE-family HTH domain